jgi:hypothetical protein
MPPLVSRRPKVNPPVVLQYTGPRPGWHYFLGQLPTGSRFRLQFPGLDKTGTVETVNPGAVYVRYDDERSKCIAVSHAAPVVCIAVPGGEDEDGGPMRTAPPQIPVVRTEEDSVQMVEKVEAPSVELPEPLPCRTHDVNNRFRNNPASSAQVRKAMEDMGMVAPEPEKENDMTKKKAPEDRKPRGRPAYVDPSGNGLQRSQVKTLLALAGLDKAAYRSEIEVVTGIDRQTLTKVLGCNDEDKRAANDEAYFPCLLTRGLIKAVPVVSRKYRDRWGYTLTAKGKKVAGKLREADEAE